jgi:hypothetical protein
MNDSPDRDPQLTDDKREGTDRATSLPEGAEDTRAKANNEAFDTLTVVDTSIAHATRYDRHSAKEGHSSSTPDFVEG